MWRGGLSSYLGVGGNALWQQAMPLKSAQTFNKTIRDFREDYSRDMRRGDDAHQPDQQGSGVPYLAGPQRHVHSGATDLPDVGPESLFESGFHSQAARIGSGLSSA